MRFGAAFWIQRTGWPELRDACLAAEAAGWDSLWVDDHLLADEGDPTRPEARGLGDPRRRSRVLTERRPARPARRRPTRSATRA